MNIAIYVGGFPPWTNGVISYVIDTAKALTKRGHTVTVFAPKPPKAAAIDTSVYPFSIRFLPSVAAIIYPDLRVTQPSFFTLTKIMKELDIDVVHINDPSPLCMEGMLAAKMMKLPVVVTFHTFFLDSDVLKNIRFGQVVGMFKSPLARLNAYVHNFADVVICPSESMQKELLDSGLTAPSIIIHNGADFSKIRLLASAEIKAERERLQIPTAAKVAIFVGRLAVDKRIDILLKAWVLVHKKNPHSYLLLVGSGPAERSLKALAHKLHLDSSVVFLGRVRREELLSSGLYSVADAYISASRIENQSMSMIEAMAHRLPVVSVNMRGAGELVDTTCGILTGVSVASLANGITSLFSDQKKLSLLGRGAEQKAHQHDSRETVKQVESLYQKLIQSS